MYIMYVCILSKNNHKVYVTGDEGGTSLTLYHSAVIFFFKQEALLVQ